MVTAKIIGGHHVHSKRVGILADFETRSPVDLKVHGASRYSRDLRTEVMCLCVADVYARIDDRGFVVDRSDKRLWLFDKPSDKAPFIPKEDEVVFAYNAEFEYLIYTQCWGVELRPSQMYCIQVQGLYNGLPAGLDKLSNAAAFTVVKDKEGHDLMVKMSKQREDGTYLYDHEKMERLCTYCIADIECEAEALEKLRPLPPYELRCYQETLAINITGIPIDMELVLSAREMNEVVGAELQAMYPDINLKSHAQIKAFAKNFGYTLVSTDKEHVADALDDPSLPPQVKDLLEIKAMGVGSSSVSKFDALVNFTDDDGYLRGSYRHHGAIRTGRWTAQGVQVTNLPRGEKAQLKVIAELRELIRARDVDGLYLKSGMRPMDALRTSIRTMFAAPKGWVFVQRDLAAIEARGAFWVAMARNLQMFHDFDAGRGEEPYMIFANKLGMDRFAGKQGLLSTNYGIGLTTLINLCHAQGRDLKESDGQAILDMHKQMFPEVKEMWKLIDDAAKGAIETPGIVTLVNTPTNPIKFLHDGKNLMLRLPSERVLTYWGARLEPGNYGKEITYMTYGAEDGKAQGWHKTRTWGGAIFGHCVQAFSACIMRDISLRLREAGIPACMLIHDECVCLVREEDAQKTFDKMTEIMNMTPAWAKGLPVKSAGWIGNFFVKD